MKNIELTLLYVEVKELSKKYTFVSIEPDFIHHEVKQLNHSNILGLHLNITQEQKHIVRVKNDKILHKACEDIFNQTTYLKYDGYLAFDALIDSPSFVKNILLEHNLYQPATQLEILLDKLGILKSYYNQEVTFYVKHTREEYSSEFGQRVFDKTIETKRVEYAHFTRGKPSYHNGSVYSSNSREHIFKIVGQNDLGKDITILENSIKNSILELDQKNTETSSRKLGM